MGRALAYQTAGNVGRGAIIPGAPVPLFALLFGLLLSGCPPPSERSMPAPSAPLGISKEAGGFAIAEDGKPVLFYQLEPKSMDGRFERSNYIHPLYGLDGEVLTEDFPEDHRHHRGVYWTWHQVVVGDFRAGDPWLARDFSWRVEEARVLPGGGGLYLRHRWHSPDFGAGKEPILEETAEIVVHPSDGNARLLDFDIRLVALQDGVQLGGSEDDKGYGGFSVRVAMIEGLQFVAYDGPVEPQRQALDAGDWVDFSADFAASGTPSGVAVIVHPSSAGYPQSWILRSPATPSMQNPVWPGPDPASLPRGEETRLRYRLVVHRGGASSVDLGAMATDFAATP